jgi:hypothetical protein
MSLDKIVELLMHSFKTPLELEVSKAVADRRIEETLDVAWKAMNIQL